MENETSITIDWTGVITQWGLFFGLMTVIFFPALKFRNLAKEHNKKGWLYFIIGLPVGIIGLNLGQVIVLPLKYYVVPEEYVEYLILVLFLSAYLSYKFCYKLLTDHFNKSKG